MYAQVSFIELHSVQKCFVGKLKGNEKLNNVSRV